MKKKKWQEKRKKDKLDIDERNNLQLETIQKLQESLKHCVEEKKIVEHKRYNLMKDRAQLETRVAQLEVTLDSEQEKQKR
ncbi:hypothetical protein GH793_16445, partial [Listeria monocytogenes]